MDRRREEAKSLARAAALDLREISHEEGNRDALFNQFEDQGEKAAMIEDVKML